MKTFNTPVKRLPGVSRGRQPSQADLKGLEKTQKTNWLGDSIMIMWSAVSV